MKYPHFLSDLSMQLAVKANKLKRKIKPPQLKSAILRNILAAKSLIADEALSPIPPKNPLLLELSKLFSAGNNKVIHTAIGDNFKKLYLPINSNTGAEIAKRITRYDSSSEILWYVTSP